MSDPYAFGWTVDHGSGVAAHDPNYDAGAGKIHDGLTYGGYGGTATADPNAAGGYSVDYSRNGLNDAVNRFQGLGQAASARKAYQANFGNANYSRDAGLQGRANQLDAQMLQRGAALGQASSRAEIMGAQAGNQSLEGALSASAGQMHGGLGAQPRGVMTMGQVAAGQASGQLGAQGQAMSGRSGEMNHAIGAYGAGAGTMRSGDYAQQGLDQQQAEAQSRSEITQRQLNQGSQMGYEGLAFNARQAQLAANQKQQETDAGIYANSLQIQNQEKNRGLAYLGAGYQAGGAGVAGLSNIMRDEASGGGGGSGGGMPLAPPQNSGGINREDPYSEDDGSDPYGGIGR